MYNCRQTNKSSLSRKSLRVCEREKLVSTGEIPMINDTLENMDREMVWEVLQVLAEAEKGKT